MAACKGQNWNYPVVSREGIGKCQAFTRNGRDFLGRLEDRLQSHWRKPGIAGRWRWRCRDGARVGDDAGRIAKIGEKPAGIGALGGDVCCSRRAVPRRPSTSALKTTSPIGGARRVLMNNDGILRLAPLENITKNVGRDVGVL